MSQLFSRLGSISIASPSGGTQTEFKGIRFAFSIEKTSESTANRAKFTIYNLSKNSRALFEQTDAIVICKLGYAGAGISFTSADFLAGQARIEQAFSGNIIKNGLTVEKVGGDIALHVECATGMTEIRDSVINKSYSEGANGLSIVNDLAAGFGLKIAQLPTGIDFGTFLNGISLSGNIKDILTNILKPKGMDWSIQDNELQITKFDVPTIEEAVLISSDTGMIGVPTKTEDGVLKFNSLLNLKLRPNKIVVLKSKNISGNFKTKKVTHTGDLEGGAFDSIVEAKEI